MKQIEIGLNPIGGTIKEQLLKQNVVLDEKQEKQIDLLDKANKARFELRLMDYLTDSDNTKICNKIGKKYQKMILTVKKEV